MRRLTITGYREIAQLLAHATQPAWLLPTVVLCVAISAQAWRMLALDVHLGVEQQVGYEDSVLCKKFGFAPGTERHSSCMLDLLELRHNDRELQARTALP